jgi:hypothetical protein
MTLRDHATVELAARLALSPLAIEEAIRRKLLSFVEHRNCRCWRFGDSRNGSFRRIDGQPFRINGDCVKAEAETHGNAWHQLIGLDDVVENDRGEILLIPEGGKDALAILHFAAAEDTIREIGVVAALGSAVKLIPDDIEKLRGRRIRIFPDVDPAGQNAAARIGEAIARLTAEVQIFDLARLYRDDGERVKDLFDVTRIDYDDFEANRGLWSLTDLDNKGERVQIIADDQEFFPSPLPPPHGSPESHGFPVYPVSSAQELEKEFEELAVRNACTERDTAREMRWQLARDLNAVEKRLARKLSPDELVQTFTQWYRVSHPYLDPKKTRDDYCGLFLAELGKVRVATGEGEALRTALARILVSPLPEIPGRPDAPESWRKLSALHRELARLSSSGIYFLSCRDAAKAHPGLNKDSANTINRALAQLGVIKLMRVGVAQPGGKASEFCFPSLNLGDRIGG